jgi:hypothetical protein
MAIPERPNPARIDRDPVIVPDAKSPEHNGERAENALQNTVSAFFIFAGIFIALLILILLFLVATLS